MAAESRHSREFARPRGVLGRAWFWVLLFMIAVLVLMALFTSGVGTRVTSEQTEFLADAVRRSAVQCYALEGRFPDNLSYLEQEYGLIIDHENYVVYYEPMGGNLIPQIRVIALQGGQ